MAKLKRRPRPSGKRDDFVRAMRDTVARSACDVPLTVNVPASYRIPEGTIGILVGPAPGAPELTIVQFDLGPGRLARVELSPRCFESFK